MDYHDFPLVATMREALRFGGDMRLLKNPVGSGRALEGPKAVAFVRNHDIDRGQNNDHGIEDPGGRNSSRPGMAGWRERLYSGLVRIATRPTEFFRIPPDRVIELGAEFEI